MESARLHLTCEHCGNRIGVYEPMWIETADGILRASSYLNLGDAELGADRRAWHRDCLDLTAEQR